MSISKHLKSIAVELDKAIELGATAAYPLIFNLPAPEGGVDWKGKVKLGWKVVRTVVGEAAKVTIDQWSDGKPEAPDGKGDVK